MIIIARHGQSVESSYQGLRGVTRAVQSGADIIELSVRLTKDQALILAWTPYWNNDRSEPHIRSATLKQLRRHTAGSKQPVAVLDDALKECFGSIMLMVHVHERAAVEPLLATLQSYTKRKKDWGSIVFCSSSPLALRKLRRLAPNAQLALVHGRHTPLAFLAVSNLQLSAVILHRLSMNNLVIEAAHTLDYLVCAYTVDRPKTMKRLEDMGVDAIVTTHPEKF